MALPIKSGLRNYSRGFKDSFVDFRLIILKLNNFDFQVISNANYIFIIIALKLSAKLKSYAVVGEIYLKF